MIYSMTGFATASAELDIGSLALELRAVNHRYLDLQLRAPEGLSALEPVLRETLAAQMTRGKVECRISFVARQSGQSPAQLDHALLRQLAQWNKEIVAVMPDAASLSVSDVLHWGGVLQSTAPEFSIMQTKVLDLLRLAMRDFAAARQREGERLRDFLLQRTAQISAMCAEVAPRIPAAIAGYQEKLGMRLRLAMQNSDEERLRQEIALFASKIDVEEELSRLQIHLTEVTRVLEHGGVVGKRLDFLVQELHREANTLGSKSVDAEVSRIAMEIKLLIEQMREQIQNVE